MSDYLFRIERERRRKTLRALAKNCGSRKRERPLCLVLLLSPEMRVIYQRASRGAGVPVIAGARRSAPELGKGELIPSKKRGGRAADGVC